MRRNVRRVISRSRSGMSRSSSATSLRTTGTRVFLASRPFGVSTTRRERASPSSTARATRPPCSWNPRCGSSSAHRDGTRRRGRSACARLAPTGERGPSTALASARGRARGTRDTLPAASSRRSGSPRRRARSRGRSRPCRTDHASAVQDEGTDDICQCNNSPARGSRPDAVPARSSSTSRCCADE